MKTVAFITLGCKVNIYESNALMNQFRENGYQVISEDKPADVFIINTCSVTNTADSKSKKMIRHAKKLNPNAIICVMGCFAQTNKQAQEMDEIDVLLGNGNKHEALERVNAAFVNREKQISLLKIREVKDYEALEATTFDHTRAFVKIEDGCSNFCSYCIIPYARGPVRCKDKDEVLKELTRIGDMGYKEVVLSGIHTGHYTCGKNYKLSNLLSDIIHNVKTIERIRLSSIEINEIDDDIINLLKEEKVLANHLHLPLQTGNDKILKLMNRKYDTAFFIDKINKIRAVRPDISITTDVIVGFPYENDEDFKETIDFIRKVNFAELHVFPYSQRSGTKAFDMPQIDGNIKKARVKELIKVSKELNHAYYESFIGKMESVLVETIYNDKYMIGHTSNYLHVLLPLDSTKIGKLVDAKMLEIKDDHMIAEPVSKVSMKLKKELF